MKIGGLETSVFPLQMILDRGLRELNNEYAAAQADPAKRMPTKVMAITLEFECPVPSKKNQLRPSGATSSARRRGFTYDKDVKKAMGDLLLFARAQWATRPPLKHPVIHFRLMARDSQDRDGMVTTLFDVLKKAGVILDDRIKDCNGLVLIHHATATNDSDMMRCRVDVEYPYIVERTDTR